MNEREGKQTKEGEGGRTSAEGKEVETEGEAGVLRGGDIEITAGRRGGGKRE